MAADRTVAVDRTAAAEEAVWVVDRTETAEVVRTGMTVRTGQEAEGPGVDHSREEPGRSWWGDFLAEGVDRPEAGTPVGGAASLEVVLRTMSSKTTSMCQQGARLKQWARLTALNA